MVNNKYMGEVGERKDLKTRMLNAKSPRLQNQARLAYKNKNHEVKKSARRDKRAFVEELANEAELAASRGELSTVYKITKQLCGKNSNPSLPVKDKHGNNIATEREQTARWVEQFREVLNRPEPDDPAEIDRSDVLLDIDTSPPSKEEVMKPSRH